MSTQEKRFFRRELINYYLQQNALTSPIFRYNVKRMVRDMEVHHYGLTLAIYSQFVTYK